MFELMGFIGFIGFIHFIGLSGFISFVEWGGVFWGSFPKAPRRA